MLIGFSKYDSSIGDLLIDSPRWCNTVSGLAAVGFSRYPEASQTRRGAGALWLYTLSFLVLECDEKQYIEP